MSDYGFLGAPERLGGNTGLNTGENGGVYSRHPATQLKYNTSWENGLQTQARLYLQIPGREDGWEAARDFGEPVQQYALVAAEYGYVDFLLQNASENYAEKVAVNEVMGDSFAAYFLGQRAPVFQYSGVLLSTQQDDWWVGFHYLYNEVLRGSKLAALGAVVHLRYDSRIITGALMDFSTSLSADMQMAVQFRFGMIVKNVTVLASPWAPTVAGYNTINEAARLNELALDAASSMGGVITDSRTVDTSTAAEDARKKLEAQATPLPQIEFDVTAGESFPTVRTLR